MSEQPPKTLKSAPPAHGAHLILSYPIAHILLLTFNRPEALNAMTLALRLDLDKVLDWFETEPDLWLVVVTGAGRAFCAGADLKLWNTDQTSGSRREINDLLSAKAGFASLSRRRSSKPIIAAVNGHALGGGTELVLNCDLVVASEKAMFGLPEVHVGVVAAAGGIQRVLRIAGHQRASEMLLTGKSITAAEAHDRFGFVNQVVPAEEVLPASLKLAQSILEQSPDAIRSTKRALNEATLHGSMEAAWKAHVLSPESRAVYDGVNIREGLKAFGERRKPMWSSPKL